MADRSAWKNFKKQMTAKRVNKKNGSGVKILEQESMTVQRLSADVSGKAQKYTRVGAREFVPFDYEEVTIPNVKLACLNHFDVRDGAICDVLAGEQGPSCSSINQIPNMRVIHVRFIDGEEVVNKPATGNPPRKKRKTNVAASVSVSSLNQGGTQKATTSKFIARSMSAVEMLKLGKEIKSSIETTEIHIQGFDIDKMVWEQPIKVDFVLGNDPIGTGGFRHAYKATSQTEGFEKTPWVVKKNLEKTVEEITLMEQTIEQHTRKNVQIHNPARNFAAKLHQEVLKAENTDKFGEVLRYNKVFFGK